ncbi:hypothetical protein JCM3766R1_002725 [Sporobolomyces carnicolor]
MDDLLHETWRICAAQMRRYVVTPPRVDSFLVGERVRGAPGLYAHTMGPDVVPMFFAALRGENPTWEQLRAAPRIETIEPKHGVVQLTGFRPVDEERVEYVRDFETIKSFARSLVQTEDDVPLDSLVWNIMLVPLNVIEPRINGIDIHPDNLESLERAFMLMTECYWNQLVEQEGSCFDIAGVAEADRKISTNVRSLFPCTVEPPSIIQPCLKVEYTFEALIRGIAVEYAPPSDGRPMRITLAKGSKPDGFHNSFSLEPATTLFPLVISGNGLANVDLTKTGLLRVWEDDHDSGMVAFFRKLEKKRPMGEQPTTDAAPQRKKRAVTQPTNKRETLNLAHAYWMNGKSNEMLKLDAATCRLMATISSQYHDTRPVPLMRDLPLDILDSLLKADDAQASSSRPRVASEHPNAILLAASQNWTRTIATASEAKIKPGDLRIEWAVVPGIDDSRILSAGDWGEKMSSGLFSVSSFYPLSTMCGIFQFDTVSSEGEAERRFTYSPYAGRRIARYFRIELRRLGLFDKHVDVLEPWLAYLEVLRRYQG